MLFRCLAILTLWTMLIGPVINAPAGRTSARPQAQEKARR